MARKGEVPLEESQTYESRRYSDSRRIGRRGFLGLTGRGVAGAAILASGLDSLNFLDRKPESPNASVPVDSIPAILTQQTTTPEQPVEKLLVNTVLYAGPGNDGYSRLATIPEGSSVTLTGRFGDFVKITSPSSQEGFIYGKGIVNASSLPELSTDDVPWRESVFASADKPLKMISAGAYESKYTVYPMLGGTINLNDGDIQIQVAIDADARESSPESSSSGIQLDNNQPEDSDAIRRLTLVSFDKGQNKGWNIAYKNGKNWELFQKLPIEEMGQGNRFTIKVNNSGTQVILTLPSGSEKTYILKESLIGVGNILTLSAKVGPYTDLTLSELSLSQAPKGEFNAQLESEDLLKKQSEKYKITMGTAVNTLRPSYDPRYEKILKTQFDLVVPEGATQWDWLFRPTKDQYNFAALDQVVNFAENNNLAVRAYLLPSGSTLDQLPTWLVNGNFSREELLEILHQHINTVVSHYKGRIKEWMVASETIWEGKFVPWNFWLKNIGPDFLEKVFKWTKEADPEAQTIYEFDRNEELSPQSDAVYNHIKDLLAKGVPIDAIGMEMHLDGAKPPNKESVATNMKRLGELGLKVKIMELDVNMANMQGSEQDKADRHTTVFKDVVEAAVKSQVCDSITTWEFVDSLSWLMRPKVQEERGRAESPLLYTNEYEEKPAVTAIINVFKNAV